MYTALIVGIVGLSIWYICTRLERGSDAGEVFFADEHKAQQAMTRSERAARRHEQSSARQYVRWFKSVGIGLTAIGFGGALLYVIAIA